MTIAAVVPLERSNAVPELVEELTLLLGMAHAGELRSIAFVGTVIPSDGERRTRCKNIGFGDQIDLLGNIAIMQHLIAAGFTE